MHRPVLAPALAAAALLLVVLGVELWLCLEYAGGRLVYPLDDTYIHMAMARNLAEHGVLGVTRHGFTSSTSSPLWTFLLAIVFKMVGPHPAVPLVLDTLLALAALLWTDGVLARATAPARARVWILVAIALLTPLPALVLGGQEHVLHALLTALFVHEGARWCLDTPAASQRRVLVAAALLPLVRYEGAFAVLVLATVIALRGRRDRAVLLLVGAAVPAGAFGAISVALGWYPVPNSVLLKATLPPGMDPGSLVSFALETSARILYCPHVLNLVLLALALAWARSRGGVDPSPPVVMAAVLVGTAILHLTLARRGWLYRYEAYLVLLGLVTVSLQALEILPSLVPAHRPPWGRAAAGLLALLLVAPLLARTVHSLAHVPPATGNIYRQPYQVARFLEEFYEGQGVALADVGLANYIADVRCLDLNGLASMEIARLVRLRGLTGRAVGAVARAHSVAIAVAHDTIVGRSFPVPGGWLRVAAWRIPGNEICASDTVVFYGIGPENARTLAAHLSAFRPRLPPDVAVLP